MMGPVLLDAAIDALEVTEPFDTPGIEAALRTSLIDGLGLKPRFAFGPVRVGITGGSDTDAASAFFDGTGGPSQTLSLPAAPDAPPGFRYQTTAFKADGTQHVAAWAASAPGTG